MIRSGIAVVAVGLVGLFGFYFLTDSSERSHADKAKDAALQVGDTVRDKGVAGLVQVRLATQFGLDATRFLHVYYDEGRVVVYGMAPESLDLEKLRTEVSKVSGVSEVEVLVNTRPAYIEPLKGFGSGEQAPGETEAETSEP
jgi:osmotically-inducible protein OsmY